MACQLKSWRAKGCIQAEVLPDPTAPKIATPVKSPRSGFVSHSGFRLGLLALLYLNNILEQDQRAIKRRGGGNDPRIRGHAHDPEGQARWVSGSDVRQQIQFINTLFEVAA